MKKKAAIASRIAEVRALFKAGAKAGAGQAAQRLFDEMGEETEVVLFYAGFSFYSLRERDIAITVLTEQLRAQPRPRILRLLSKLCARSERNEHIMEVARQYFLHPELAGLAYASYASALLRTTGKLDQAVGLFRRAARLGGLGTSESATSMMMSPKSFRNLAELVDNPDETPIQFLGALAEHRPSFIFCASGDEAYFRAFYDIYRDSFFTWNEKTEHALHFHLFDPSDALLEEIGAAASPSGRVQFSFERTDGANRTYYYVGRFVQMPRLLEHYQCPIAVTDIDCVFKRDIDDIIRVTAGTDLALLAFNVYDFPWEVFRANLTVFSPTPIGMLYARALRNFLVKVPAGKVDYWFVDQLGLVECAYMHRNLGIGNVATFLKEYEHLCYQPTGQSGNATAKADRARELLAVLKGRQGREQAQPQALADDEALEETDGLEDQV